MTSKDVERQKQSDLEQADLGELAAIANKFHEQVEESGRSMLQAAWNAGQALLNAKVLCEHGDWIPWVEANFHGSLRTAQVYMQLANAQTSAHLESGTSIDSALDSIRDQAAPPKAKRGKGKQLEPSSRDRYVKRYNAVSESLSVIVHDIQNDSQFASAARENLDALVELRDGLTKTIAYLKKAT